MCTSTIKGPENSDQKGNGKDRTLETLVVYKTLSSLSALVYSATTGTNKFYFERDIVTLRKGTVER